MRKTTALLLAALISGLSSVAALTQESDFRQRFTAVTPTNFDSGGEISRQFHLSAESYLPMSLIARTKASRNLPVTPMADLESAEISFSGGTAAFAEYVEQDAFIDGVVVLHGGKIVFEAYPRMEPWQRHFAWSVTKVVTSTALAVLVEQGHVDMEATVSEYLPALIDTAWADTPVQQVADMASGIDCLDSDGYHEKTTCIYQMEESLGLVSPSGRDPEFEAHLSGMKQHVPAGTANEYVSANTIVLSLVVEAVSGKSFARFLQDSLWSAIGAEADGLMAISDDGYAIAHAGLSARLRDIARFGLLFTNAAPTNPISSKTVMAMRNGGVPISEGMARGIGVSRDDLPLRASWQWDAVWGDGGMYKSGYLGQGLYVDPDRDLVVAWFGTGEDFGAEQNELLPVTRQLARLGLFDR